MCHLTSVDDRHANINQHVSSDITSKQLLQQQQGDEWAGTLDVLRAHGARSQTPQPIATFVKALQQMHHAALTDTCEQSILTGLHGAIAPLSHGIKLLTSKAGYQSD